MKEVKFAYDVDDIVVTSLGSTGVVKMLGYDDAGPQYYVQCKNNASWWKEKHCFVSKESLPSQYPSLDICEMKELEIC